MLIGIFYLKFASEYLGEFCDCRFSSYVWADEPSVFCFWYRLKGISSWNNLINIIFFLHFFFSLLDRLSSRSLFTASLTMAKRLRSFIPIAQQLVLKKESPLERRNWAKLTHQTWCPHLGGVKDIWDFLPPYFCTHESLCSCCSPFLLSLFLSYLDPFVFVHHDAISPDLCPLLFMAYLFCLDSVFCFYFNTGNFSA